MNLPYVLTCKAHQSLVHWLWATRTKCLCSNNPGRSHANTDVKTAICMRCARYLLVPNIVLFILNTKLAVSHIYVYTSIFARSVARALERCDALERVSARSGRKGQSQSGMQSGTCKDPRQQYRT